MSGAAARPAFGAPGQTGAESNYYNNLLNRQKEATANVPAVQQAQGQPSQPPNRPGPTPDGFGGQQQGQMGPEMSRYQGAYNSYMQRYGQGLPQPPQQTQPSAPAEFDQNRQQPPGPPRRPGIRMGAGYAARD